MDVNKASLDMLERAFTREIEGAIGGRSGLLQVRSKLAAKLAADGYLEHTKLQIPSRLGPITIAGYALTHLGRMTYCASDRCAGDAK